MKKELDSIKFPKRKSKRRKPSEIQLFLMAMLGIIFIFIFAYLPMFGIILAFKDGDGYLSITKAITDAPWCGFDNFINFSRIRISKM